MANTESAEVVSGALTLVGLDVGTEEISGWSEDQVEQALAWVGAVHFSASDNRGIKIPPKPAFLEGAKELDAAARYSV